MFADQLALLSRHKLYMQRPLNMTGSRGGASEHESYFQHTGFRCGEDRPKREMTMLEEHCVVRMKGSESPPLALVLCC